MTHTFYYSNASRRQHFGKVFLNLIIFGLFIGCFFLYTYYFYIGDVNQSGFDWSDFLNRLKSMGVIFSVGMVLGLVLNTMVMGAFKIEIGNEKIVMDGFGYAKTAITFSEISEIVELPHGIIEIRSESLNRSIKFVSSYFAPEGYQIIKDELETWHPFSKEPVSRRDRLKPWTNWGILVLCALLVPVFISSEIQIVKVIPNLLLLGGIGFALSKLKKKPDNFKIGKVFLYLIALTQIGIVIARLLEWQG